MIQLSIEFSSDVFLSASRHISHHDLSRRNKNAFSWEDRNKKTWHLLSKFRNLCQNSLTFKLWINCHGKASQSAKRGPESSGSTWPRFVFRASGNTFSRVLKHFLGYLQSLELAHAMIVIYWTNSIVNITSLGETKQRKRIWGNWGDKYFKIQTTKFQYSLEHWKHCLSKWVSNILHFHGFFRSFLCIFRFENHQPWEIFPYIHLFSSCVCGYACDNVHTLF